MTERKIRNSKIIIVLSAILLCIAGALLFKLLSGDREISASISPANIFIGEYIDFIDSTKNAKNWLWEFGDGGESIEKSGKYKPKNVGSLSIRLTVDNQLSKRFLINIRNRPGTIKDRIITIEAPSEAMQGEYISIIGNGDANEWRWSFGESSKIDSRERISIYSYSKPGVYEIELSTETTEYPVRQSITILPTSVTNRLDAESPGSKIGNDIRERLQAIADGKPFNTHYNYILNRYLSQDPNTQVLVNNDKGGNSIWSYCMGLKMTGKGTTIQEVEVDIKPGTRQTVSKLKVTQDTDH